MECQNQHVLKVAVRYSGNPGPIMDHLNTRNLPGGVKIRRFYRNGHIITVHTYKGDAEKFAESLQEAFPQIFSISNEAKDWPIVDRYGRSPYNVKIMVPAELLEKSVQALSTAVHRNIELEKLEHDENTVITVKLYAPRIKNAIGFLGNVLRGQSHSRAREIKYVFI